MIRTSLMRMGCRVPLVTRLWFTDEVAEMRQYCKRMASIYRTVTVIMH